MACRHSNKRMPSDFRFQFRKISVFKLLRRTTSSKWRPCNYPPLCGMFIININSWNRSFFALKFRRGVGDPSDQLQLGWNRHTLSFVSENLEMEETLWQRRGASLSGSCCFPRFGWWTISPIVLLNCEKRAFGGSLFDGCHSRALYWPWA